MLKVRKNLNLAALFLGSIFLLLPQGRILDAKERVYRKGAYMRVQGGLGQGIFALRHLSETNSSFVSNSSFINFQMGSVVALNCILYAGISSSQALQTRSPVRNHRNSSYSHTSISTGLNYYIMPYNIYLSPEIRIFGNATLRYQNFTMSPGIEKEQRFDTGTGYGLSIGKEWPLADSNFWNIGIAFTAYQDSFRGKHERTRMLNQSLAQGENNFDQAKSTLIGFSLSLSFHRF